MKTYDTIQASDLAAALDKEDCQLIDVREPIEHAESHVEGARLIPLGELDSRLGEIQRGKPIVVMCHAGKRGAAAAEKLNALGFDSVKNLEGGMLAWQACGLPCAASGQRVMPLMRQVQIAVGFCVLVSSVLAVTVDLAWIYLSMFFGAGLLFAGLTGFCGLAMVLARMPWNRVKPAHVRR